MHLFIYLFILLRIIFSIDFFSYKDSWINSEANRTLFDFLFLRVFDAVTMEADEGVVQQESEENERSSAVSEEKALSDSEIKVPSFCLAVIPVTQSCILLKEQFGYILNAFLIPLSWWFTSSAFRIRKSEFKIAKVGNKHGQTGMFVSYQQQTSKLTVMNDVYLPSQYSVLYSQC